VLSLILFSIPQTIITHLRMGIMAATMVDIRVKKIMTVDIMVEEAMAVDMGDSLI
jgi:hypothetical protein